MVPVARCKIEGCQARAWHGTLCNLHAFERHHGKRYPSTAERLQRGKALLQARARELGVEVHAPAIAFARKVPAKSPGPGIRY